MMSIGSFINMETLVLKKGKHTDSGYACVICTIIYGVIMAICIYKKCCENKKLNDESEAKANKSVKSDEANINVEETKEEIKDEEEKHDNSLNENLFYIKDLREGERSVEMMDLSKIN